MKLFAYLNYCGYQAVFAAVFLGSISPAAQADQPLSAADVKAILESAQHDPNGSFEDLRIVKNLIEDRLRITQGLPTERAQWLHVQWYLHLLMDDHVQAARSSRAAIELLLDAGIRSVELGQLYHDLSYSLILQGELARAKDYLRQGVALAIELRSAKLEADCYYAIADAHLKTGEMRLAKRYFMAARDYYNSQSDEFTVMISDLKLGTIERLTGNVDNAIDLHQRALEYFVDKKLYREIVARIELARDLAALGQFEQAISHAASANEDSRALVEQQVDAKIILLQIENNLIESELFNATAGRVSASLVTEIDELLNEQEEIIDGSRERPIRQLNFAREAIRHYALQSNIESALSYGENSLRLIESVAETLEEGGEDYLRWVSAAYPTLVAYVSVLYDERNTNLVSVLSRIGHLKRRFAKNLAPSLLDHASDARVMAALAGYTFAERNYMNARDDANSVKGISVKEALRKRDLARELYILSTPTASEKQVVQYSSLPSRNFQVSDMPADQLILRYFVHDAVSFVLVIGQDSVDFVDLPPRRKLQELVAKADKRLRRAAVVSRAESIQALRTLIPLSIIEKFRDVRRLVIIPDDSLHLVPFAALNISANGVYRPLVVDYDVVRTHSVGDYFSSEESSPTVENTADVFVFADPIFKNTDYVGMPSASYVAWTSRLKRLKFTAEEAVHISTLMSDYDVRLHLGSQATSAALTSVTARTSRILHIATHGYYDKETPEIVGIATSKDNLEGGGSGGFLSLTELLGRKIAANLVVVSGCDTMRGDEYRGFGARSIAEGFLTRGAGSAIGTLWEVSDRATATFMRTFYSALVEKGGNTTEALALAQREMLASADYRDPYYWAGFVLESVHDRYSSNAFR